ncbi:hypothetical protein ACIRL2_26490 [Embleya sp. NPDC127516]|uniref:hypothetical protein n=1 Tax=Embleya sp. NPDC127516 TaxID=3363990 RepID=UPI00382D3AC6
MLRRSTAVAAALVVLLATGCSVVGVLDETSSESSDNSALGDAKLRDRVRALVERARSVHVVVDAIGNGEPDTHTDMRLDARTGDFTARMESGDLVVEVISVGSDVYVRATRLFWADALGYLDPQDDALINDLYGKYAHLVSDDPLRADVLTTSKSYDPRGFVGVLAQATRRAGPAPNAHPSIVFEQTGPTGTTHVFIPSKGRPLPERAILTGAPTHSRTIAWSDYDAPTRVLPPTPDLILEMPYGVNRSPSITAPPPVAHGASPAGDNVR